MSTLSKEHREKRLARFTSSQIYKLCSNGRKKDEIFGAPAYTYIEEKRIEKKMGCSIKDDFYSKETIWGNFCEPFAFKELGLEYKMVSKDSIVHPDPEFAAYWSGSCDFIVPDKKIAELKCYQKKKFAQYTEAILAKNVDLLRDNFADEYWQIVSNAILNRVDYGEAISYMPYRKQWEDFYNIAADVEIWGSEQWKYRFIAENEPWQLAMLPDDSGYKSLNKFEFRIPPADIELLTDRVRLAKKYLDLEGYVDIRKVEIKP